MPGVAAKVRMGHSDDTGRTEVVLLEHVASARSILKDIKVLIMTCSVFLQGVPSRVIFEAEAIAAIAISRVLLQGVLTSAHQVEAIAAIAISRVLLQGVLTSAHQAETMAVVVGSCVFYNSTSAEDKEAKAGAAVARGRVLPEHPMEESEAKAGAAVACGRVLPERPSGEGTTEAKAGAGVARSHVLRKGDADLSIGAEAGAAITRGRIPLKGDTAYKEVETIATIPRSDVVLEGYTDPPEDKAVSKICHVAVLDGDSDPKGHRQNTTYADARTITGPHNGMAVAVKGDVIGLDSNVASVILGQRRVGGDGERASGPPSGERHTAEQKKGQPPQTKQRFHRLPPQLELMVSRCLVRSDHA
jgi:hypothetical protein